MVCDLAAFLVQNERQGIPLRSLGPVKPDGEMTIFIQCLHELIIIHSTQPYNNLSDNVIWKRAFIAACFGNKPHTLQCDFITPGNFVDVNITNVIKSRLIKPLRDYLSLSFTTSDFFPIRQFPAVYHAASGPGSLVSVVFAGGGRMPKYYI